jgi:hypothetical protein
MRTWTGQWICVCYLPQPFTSERQRVEYLFGLYEQLTTPLLPPAAAKRPRHRRRHPIPHRLRAAGPLRFGSKDPGRLTRRGPERRAHRRFVELRPGRLRWRTAPVVRGCL